jgi:hypothetical protein
VSDSSQLLRRREPGRTRADNCNLGSHADICFSSKSRMR